MKEITRIELSKRTTEKGYKVLTKTYFTDFNDDLGERKLFVMEYTFNKYGFVCHKTLEVLNYKASVGKTHTYYFFDNMSIIDIHIGSYTKQITKSIDCFLG